LTARYRRGKIRSKEKEGDEPVRHLREIRKTINQYQVD